MTEKQYDPDTHYTPSVEYDERYYLLGNFHYVPEDAEHSRNPMFRVTREFQEQLKLEMRIQQVFIQEVQTLAKNGQLITDDDLEKHRKAKYRLEQLAVAYAALDNYYAGSQQSGAIDLSSTIIG